MKRTSNDLSRADLTGETKDETLGQAIAQYLSAFDSGETFAVDAWCERHPELADQFRNFVKDHQRVDRLLYARDTKAEKQPEQGGTDGAGQSTNRRSSATPPDEIRTVPRTPLSATTDFPASQEFGDYFILGQLGQGGMGTVYAAAHREIGRVVALKIIRGRTEPGTIERARFQREVESIARLDHPNVIPIYDYGTVSDVPYYTMKQVISGTLGDLREANERSDWQRSDWQRIAKIVLNVANGLQHAHDRGILHRDLKPNNVLLDEEKNPYIADFGLAKHLDGFDTASGVALGTPAYMAPEQAKGDATVQTDVFSVGAILFYLLTGNPPIQTTHWAEWLRTADDWKAPSLLDQRPDVPIDLAAICSKCLQREPGLRYPSARLLADDLQRWLRGEPTTARNPSTATKFWYWCRRHPLVAGLSAALLATLIGSTATISALYLRSERLRVEAVSNFNLANEATATATLQRNRLRQALQDMTADVTSEWLFGFDELTSSQRQFLTNASDYYREFVKENDDDPEDLLWLADAEHRLAQLLKRLGKADEAMASAIRGLEILDRLPASFEPDRVHLKRLELLVARQSWLADSGKLKEALEIAQTASKLADDIADVSTLQSDVRLRIGQLRIDEGRWLRRMFRLPEAIEALEKALQWNQAIAADPDHAWQADRQLGLSWFYLAMCQMSMKNFEDAASSFEEAAAIQLDLAEAEPDQWVPYSDYCYTLDNVGVMYGSQGQFDKAIDYIQQASDSRRPQLLKFPQADTIRRAQGQSLINLASMLSRVNRWEQRREVLRECIQVAETGRQQAPSITDYEFFYWVAQFGLVDDLIRQQNSEAAVSALNDAIPKLQDSVQANPSNAKLKQQLERAYFYRAEQLSLLGKFEESLADWDSAIELSRGLLQSNLKFRRNVTLARYNQQEDWSEELEQIEETICKQMEMPAKIRYPDLFYNAACFHAILAGNASSNEQREEHQNSAISYLQQALEYGWRDLEKLETDQDLSILRALPEFQELTGEAE